MDSKIKTYKQNRKLLNNLTRVMINSFGKYGIQKNIQNNRFANIEGNVNRLVETPANIIKEIEALYIRDEDELEGEIGVDEDETVQFDGIIDLALLIIVSNKLKNYYGDALRKYDFSSKERETVEKNKRKLLTFKDQATSDLIAALFILCETGKDYKDFFSYGNRIDDEGKDTFAMDIPFIGQMCVHYGSNSKRIEILESAKNKISSILQIKKEKGQITEKQYQELIEKVEKGEFLPEYASKLHEYDSSIPIEYEGENIKKVKKILGIDKKLPENLTDEDIEKIVSTGLNPREAHYLGVKLGFSKELFAKMDLIIEQSRASGEISTLREVRTLYTSSLQRSDLQSIQMQINRALSQTRRR